MDYLLLSGLWICVILLISELHHREKCKLYNKIYELEDSIEQYEGREGHFKDRIDELNTVREIIVGVAYDECSNTIGLSVMENKNEQECVSLHCDSLKGDSGVAKIFM